jgi:hypothetical protein
MLRAIVAVVAGYAVIVLVVALTFSAAYTMMGVDGAFEPGTYAVSTQWLVASIGLSILGAVAGGAVASAILRSSENILAALVLVVGLGLAVLTPHAPDGEAPLRLGELSSLEAIQNARQPTWLMYLNPVLGAVFVLVGARLRQVRTPALPAR